MDRDLAILVVNACYRASRDLGELGVMMSDYASDEQGTRIRHQAGRSISEIGVILDMVFAVHPDLEGYVEGMINKYGKVS